MITMLLESHFDVRRTLIYNTKHACVSYTCIPLPIKQLCAFTYRLTIYNVTACLSLVVLIC